MHTFSVICSILFFHLAADIAPPPEGLILWLDAADKTTIKMEDGFVARWASKTPGMPFNAEADGARRPGYIARETGVLRPAISFDGVDDVLRIPAFHQEPETWSLIMVCAPRCPVKGGGLCSANPVNGHDYDPGFTVDLYQASTAFDQVSVEGAGRMGGQMDQMQSALPCGGLHVLAVVRGENTVRLFIDGKEEAPRPVNPARTIMEELRLGARYYDGVERQYFNGEIAQVFLYNRALSGEQRQEIEQRLRVSEAECKAAEEFAAREEAAGRAKRMENRMKPPEVAQAWPSIEAYANAQTPSANLAILPIRADLREAIGLGMRHMNNLYDRDRNDEPFFYANRMADGTGKMFHSVNIGIPHVVGRCLLACMMGEKATGIPFPEEGLQILERYLRSSFANPDNLNSYYDPEKNGARCIEFHNMREGLYGLWALIAGRDSKWAREKARAMLCTLDMLTDEEGRWSQKRIDMCRMQDRCFGVSIPNASRMIEPLLAYYECSNDPIAMKLAALYAKQGLKTVFTPEGRFAPMPQSSGHVHSITCSLSGIAAYAARTGDREMLEACVRIMKVGVPEYFSSWGWGDEVFPDHPADEISRGEINQTGDVIRAALILGNAGFPEFYEMAERYLRSMMLPTQHHEPELRSFLRDKEHPADDSEREVLRRSIGGYAMQRPNDRMRPGDWPVTTLDITSGAVHAMSECYRQRVNIRDRACTVNLLFDYDDDSIRIKSGLPLEGRIAFEVKKPLDQLRIRVPDWVQSGNLQVQVNGQPKPVPLAGIYLELGGLQAGDAVVVLFDVPCRREKETVDGIGYTTTWIGNQIMEILPRGEVSPLPF